MVLVCAMKRMHLMEDLLSSHSLKVAASAAISPSALPSCMSLDVGLYWSDSESVIVAIQKVET